VARSREKDETNATITRRGLNVHASHENDRKARHHNQHRTVPQERCSAVETMREQSKGMQSNRIESPLASSSTTGAHVHRHAARAHAKKQQTNKTGRGGGQMQEAKYWR